MACGRIRSKMKTKKPTPKMSGLVVAALRNLRDAHGSTAKEIMKYIMAEYNASEVTVQRQLKTALKRGVEYGILKKTNAGYSLNTDAEVIGPLDMAQMDGCGKRRKRMSCKPKRRACGGCPKKRKRASCPRRRKRSACPRRRRKRNPCNTCASRGRKSDCTKPVQLVHEPSPAIEDDTSSRRDDDDQDKRSDDEQDAKAPRSRSTSKGPTDRSRSQSFAASYSGSDNEDDQREDDV